MLKNQSVDKVNDEAENASIRSEYRQLMDEARKPGAKVPTELLNRASLLLDRVERPHEALLDSEFMTEVSKSMLDIIQQGRQGPFSVDQFAVNLLNNKLCVETEKTSDISSQKWVDLGKSVRPLVKRPPYLTYLLGSIERDSDSYVAAKKTRRAPVKDHNQRLVPTQYTTGAKESAIKTVSIEKLVDETYRFLSLCFRENNKQKVNYFRFVVDPNSFSATIRNMFHTSFLVKERKASILVDGYGIPFIKPLKKKALRNANDVEEDVRSNQLILTMTKAQWESLVDVLDIKKAMIDIPEDDDGPEAEAS